MIVYTSEWNMRDSCGRKGLNETPQSVARGGSLAAHGKRVYSICGNRRATFFHTFFYSPFNDGGYTSTVWH